MTVQPSSSIKPFLRVLAGETLSPPPVWLMRQAGRYLPEYRQTRGSVRGFLDLCYSPDLAVEVTLQPLRRYAFDAAILFSDILVVPDGLGQKVVFRESVGPVLRRLDDEADVNRLDPDRLPIVLAPVYETVRRLRAAIPDTTALIGFAGAPWTVATYMVEGGGSKDFGTVKRWAFGGGPMDRLMDILVNATTRHLLAQIEAGAEVIQIFDTWAGVLPENEFRRWVVQPTRTIVEALRAAHPQVPIIAFPRNAGVLAEMFVAETGVDAMSLDSSVPLAWAAEHLQPHCVVQGNLDPQLVVVGGPRMIDQARRIVGVLGKRPFIFNLGHGIVPQTPPDHVAALIEAIRHPG